MKYFEQRKAYEEKLFVLLKQNLEELQNLFNSIDGHLEEDGIYRFYHQSFKVYHLQHFIKQTLELFKKLDPGSGLNSWYLKIVEEGTKKDFEMSDNDHWLEATRPIVEAYFHTKYFLEMLVKYGNELDESPTSFLPSGYAAVLYLYNIR